jgi:hypothetical protein
MPAALHWPSAGAWALAWDENIASPASAAALSVTFRRFSS